VSVRRYPCFCAACVQEDFSQCLNKEYAGSFSRRTMHKVGLRVPTSRFNDALPSASTLAEHYIAKSILGNRMYEGRYQYQIEWEGYDDTTWHDADKLPCIDLMEVYEINKE
jgi:hypothetical protein